MTHEITLDDKPFNSMEKGIKTVELCLNDEKRQSIDVEHEILFVNRDKSKSILTEVIDVKRYPSFEESYKHYDKRKLGYEDNEEANPKDMLNYYSEKEEEQYGVVGIEVRKLTR